jgi:hypothetical protein
MTELGDSLTLRQFHEIVLVLQGREALEHRHDPVE